MRHEKIIKRADGSRVKIVVNLYTPLYTEKYNYKTEVFTCQPGKRTFYDTVNEDDYRYMALSIPERAAYKDWRAFPARGRARRDP